MRDLTGIVAFIHAKGTSSRVSSKNKQMLGGRPLFLHAIIKASAAELVDHIVIDSDDDEILEIGERYGAIPLKRPAELATNATAGDGLESWAAYNCPFSDAIAVVIPTSPFIKPESIDNAIKMLIGNDADSVAGVRSSKLFLWRDGKPAYGSIRTTQELPLTTWETTGLYVTKTDYINKHHQRINYENCLPFELSRLESVDIDTPEDLEFARMLYAGMYQ
jgi:CMP-N-acetylneuraminic acid synthetase